MQERESRVGVGGEEVNGGRDVVEMLGPEGVTCGVGGVRRVCGVGGVGGEAVIYGAEGGDVARTVWRGEEEGDGGEEGVGCYEGVAEGAAMDEAVWMLSGNGVICRRDGDSGGEAKEVREGRGR